MIVATWCYCKWYITGDKLMISIFAFSIAFCFLFAYNTTEADGVYVYYIMLDFLWLLRDIGLKFSCHWWYIYGRICMLIVSHITSIFSWYYHCWSLLVLQFQLVAVVLVLLVVYDERYYGGLAACIIFGWLLVLMLSVVLLPVLWMEIMWLFLVCRC